MASFVLTETQLAYCTSLHFLHFPPETAGGFAMPYFAYLASQKASSMMYHWGVAGMTAV